MRYKCDIKLMGVPERLAHITETSLQLGIGPNDCFIDYAHLGSPLKTSRGAFNLPAEQGVTHRCVIQDDIDFCENFVPFVDYLVNHYPDAIFTLFCGSSKVKLYEAGTIIKTGGQFWGPAVIIPLHYLDEIYRDLDAYNPDYKHDDCWYADWAIKHKVKTLTTIPTPVNTIPLMDSSMKHNNVCKSHWFEKGDIMQYDWKDLSNKSMGLSRKLL
jgi:hypothetical protein